MNIEHQIKKALTMQDHPAQPPQSVKKKVIEGLTAVPVRRQKKKLAAGVLAALLFVPTSAFSYQVLVADDFYGSFRELKQHFASATMENYMLLNAKLLQAKGELGQEEYGQFKEALQSIIQIKLQYGNEEGNVIYDRMSKKEKKRARQALMEAQPYFDQLNGQPSSKDVLTGAEYEAYIDALITYENITAQNRSGNAAKTDLAEAVRIMDEVNAKQAEASFQQQP